MAVRWCFLGSHEIPEGERMVMPARGGAQICVPCAETPRGQALMRDTRTTDGYRRNDHPPAGKWSRIYRAMQQPGYARKKAERS